MGRIIGGGGRVVSGVPSNGVTWNDGVTWNKKKVLLPAVIALPIITLKIKSIPFWKAVRKYYSRF